ncbi:thiamine phosphate synthase [Brevirhabdus sp.]|uniref:thiamine phosphate synthase n=1 Tax=Brevirhabdus sp. TaxID=2004514 RepID=UPI0040582042
MTPASTSASASGSAFGPLDPFYPIFDHVDWLHRLVPLGIRLVQLRLKDRPARDLRAQIRAARDLCTRHGCTLVVNDHWRIAIDEGCDWVHLGQEDLDGADTGAIRDAGLKLGVSTHDRAELARALDLAPDYVALGPIYPTILKKMKWHQQGLEKLGEWKGLIGDVPLIAIGGMNVARAGGAFAAGADVVSAVTDITLNPDPEARVAEWLTATGRARAPA